MKPWAILFAWLGLAGAAVAADTDRFSQWLTAPEQKEIGLERLTSDQVAVLDALVRREVNRPNPRPEGTPAEFSQRLTPDERRNAGFNVLTPAEAARVDVLTGRYAGAKLARTLLSPPVYLSRARIVEPAETRKGREIHGSFSLSMGWGSGGYSEKSGSMMLRMDDPEHRYSISVGYTETHVKGAGGIYRDDSLFPRYLPEPRP